MMKLFALVGLFVSVSANATLFSLTGVIDQSDSFSVSVNGITMTIDNPSPYGLSNFTDDADGLDFGDATPLVGEPWILRSFDVSFSQMMSLTSLSNAVTLETVQYSIFGDGVASTGNVLSNSAFNGGPLLFKAGERYTFSNEAPPGSVGVITGINASSVPIPAAAWLLGSALLGLGVLKRRKA
jgi:hypothetical protein